MSSRAAEANGRTAWQAELQRRRSSIDEDAASEQIERVQAQLPVDVPFGEFAITKRLAGIGDDAHYSIGIHFSGRTERFAMPDRWAQIKPVHGTAQRYSAYDIKDTSDDRIRVMIRQVLAHWLEEVAILVIGREYL